MITIFTSTYNRAYILPVLFDSLKKQTNFNFEWIVVDDGSVDNTETLFNEWSKNDLPFKIYYKKVFNGGKHRAINLGVEMAKGYYFFIVDSDDYLSNDAVETIYKMTGPIQSLSDFCGVSGLHTSPEGNLYGSTFSGKEYLDCYFYDRKKNNILGDMAEVYKTDILKKYKFPEFENENFLIEGAVWYKIGYDYKIRYYNKAIKLGNYLEDGLSKTLGKTYFNYPIGGGYINKILKEYGNLSFLEKIRLDYSYLYAYNAHYPLDDIQKWMGISKIRFRLIHLIYSIKKKFK